MDCKVAFVLTNSPQKTIAASPKLSCGIAALDDFFDGGLPLGHLIEWGAPWGRGGRDGLLLFLAQATRQKERPWWCLWIHAHEQTQIYPPAWQARGIDWTYLRLAESKEPLKDLKPILMDPFFRLIVFDAPLSTEECAFLARRARIQKQLMIVVRSFFLSPKQGNVWAKLRMNCWREDDKLCWRSVRGLSPRQLALPHAALQRHALAFHNECPLEPVL